MRKTRIALAVLFLIGITLLFLDFTGLAHHWLGWMAKIQFLPAVFALNIGVIVLLVLLPLIMGRIYCSVICPMGVMQDVIARIGRHGKKRRYMYSYSKPKNWLRYGVLALFVIAVILGISSIVALLAPYSSFGRIVSSLFAPLYKLGNNSIAMIAERADSYAFYQTDIWIKSIPTLVVASATFILIAVLAWRNGRTYCNTICPVGTVLGFLSRYSWFRIRIDADKCNRCGLCSRTCKAACIDGQTHTVDYSRCVTCMDCIGTCAHGAISFSSRRSKPVTVSTPGITVETAEVPADEPEPTGNDMSRRDFLTVTALLAGAATVDAASKTVDGGLAIIEDKKEPPRRNKIVPPGALSVNNLATHCTACQLCVSACPNSVLRPSADLDSLMQPVSSYERGYCRPECTRCSEVCPTGAIVKIDRAEKSSIQIGHAVWVKANCIPLTDGVECGNCARHCPVGAISMVPSDPNDEFSVRIPAVNSETCIGCGACENLCPARPFSAIYVEGHIKHRTI